MSVFTVASGPINFGASGGDEDFFGGSNVDQSFTAAAVTAYAQPEPSPEFPTTSYANAPWDVSEGYTAQEPATYPAAHAAADDVHQSQAPPPSYSNPLYDEAAAYQPPQATPWSAPEAEVAAAPEPEFSYNPPAAAVGAPPPFTYAEALQEKSTTSQWNTAPTAPVPSYYEASIAKRELSFRQNIVHPSVAQQPPPPPPPPSVAPHQSVHPTPWTMPAANPSVSFTDDFEEDDAALFDQIDATFSGTLDTDSLISSSGAETATPAATPAAAVAAPTSSATTPSAAAATAAVPLIKTETQVNYPFSPPAAIRGSQARTYAPSPLQPPPQQQQQQQQQPPTSPPRFHPAPPPQAPPPTAPPTYQYGSTGVPTLPTHAINNPAPPPLAAPPADAVTAAPGSGPISGVSSRGSSPRLSNVNLEAGRRKLEEYKRRKQAVLGARRTPPSGASTVSSPRAGGTGGGGGTSGYDTAAIKERFQAELDAALSRATAAEASSAEMSRDLDHVLRQLETVDQERNSLQREKAAMVGEMMALQAALETAQTQATNNQNAENNIRNAEIQIQELEAARNDLITLFEKERNEHRHQLNALKMEKENALAQGDENSQRVAQQAHHFEEVNQWIAATQADSQAVREDNEKLRQELETALAAAAAAEAARASAVDVTPSAPAAVYDETNQQCQEQQISALQLEVQHLHAELESERAQRNEVEAILSSTQMEQEQQRQQWMDHAAQLQTKIHELEQQRMQMQQQTLQPPVAYYGGAGAEPFNTTPMDNTSASNGGNAVEVEQALARALAAETDLEAVRSELETTRQEAAVLRENVSRLQSEAAAVDKLHLDSPSNSRRAVNNDPESLRYRLAKAEAAVEKERRMIQALERQVRDGEAAAAEGRASTAAAFELRHRLDAAEREASAAKAAVEQLQSTVSASSGTMPDTQVQQMLSRLRVAEEKANSTDAIASDLRSQCDAAAKTIAKLVEENQDLMDRLNRQGNVMAELRESREDHHQHHHQQLSQHHHQQQEQQQQFDTPGPTANAAPPVWNIPGAVPMQSSPPPQQGGYYNNRVAEEIQATSGGGDRHGAVSPRYSYESTAGGSGGGGKKKGFWSWLAGEDLVD